jgi:hypothetical protein
MTEVMRKGKVRLGYEPYGINPETGVEEELQTEAAEAEKKRIQDEAIAREQALQAQAESDKKAMQEEILRLRAQLEVQSKPSDET